MRRDLTPDEYAAWEPLIEIARNVGVAVIGTRGIGKSTLLFLFTWLDAVVRQIPTIVFLPARNIFDLFVMQVSLLPPADQAEIWKRVRLIPMRPVSIDPTNPDDPIENWRVTQTGLYAPSGIGVEAASDIAKRFPEILLLLEEKLKDATIQGYPAILEASSMAGEVLIPLGLGITHMRDLLLDYDSPFWQQKLREAEQADPNVAEAVAFFRTRYTKMTPGKRDERTNALFTRLSKLSSPLMQAQFGPPTFAVPWKEVFEQKLIVFIDISYPEPEDAKSFKMLTMFQSVYDAIRRYGAMYSGDRNRPISLIIDEIAVMIGGKDSPMSNDFDAFVNTHSRNYNINFVASFQEPYQIEDDKILQTIFSLGTKFYARLTSPDSARIVADRAIPFDLYKIKETTYRHVGGARNGWDEAHHTYMNKQEQLEEGRKQFEQLPRGHYLVQRTVREGDPPQPLHPFSITPFLLRYPDPGIVRYVTQKLLLRDGQRVGDVLARLHRFRQPPAQPPPDPALPPDALQEAMPPAGNVFRSRRAAPRPS